MLCSNDKVFVKKEIALNWTESAIRFIGRRWALLYEFAASLDKNIWEWKVVSVVSADSFQNI